MIHIVFIAVKLILKVILLVFLMVLLKNSRVVLKYDILLLNEAYKYNCMYIHNTKTCLHTHKQMPGGPQSGVRSHRRLREK